MLECQKYPITLHFVEGHLLSSKQWLLVPVWLLVLSNFKPSWLAELTPTPSCLRPRPWHWPRVPSRLSWTFAGRAHALERQAWEHVSTASCPEKKQAFTPPILFTKSMCKMLSYNFFDFSQNDRFAHNIQVRLVNTYWGRAAVLSLKFCCLSV